MVCTPKRVSDALTNPGAVDEGNLSCCDLKHWAQPKLNAKALHSMLLVQIAYVYNAKSMLSTLQLIQNNTTQQYTTYHHEMRSASGHVHVCQMWSKWLPALYCRPFTQWTKKVLCGQACSITFKLAIQD